jgi:signal transduction histidine kinase
MFVNLILNAIQAIEADGIIIITTEEKNNHIRIEITDNGEGIPPENIQNIFNPFFTTREIGSGVGLGLSLAYRIIESHNGNIDVQSELEHGTTFTIRLPIVSC